MIKRALLVATVAMLIFAGLLWAATALTSTVTVHVTKPIDFIGQSNFTFDLIVGESRDFQVTVANTDTVDHSIAIAATTTPPNPGLVNYKSDGVYTGLLIPAGGQTTFNFTVVAMVGIAEGVYEIEFDYDVEW